MGEEGPWWGWEDGKEGRLWLGGITSEKKQREKKLSQLLLRVKRVYKVFEEGIPSKLPECLKEHPRTFDILEELTKAKHNEILCHQNWMPSYQQNIELRSFLLQDQ